MENTTQLTIFFFYLLLFLCYYAQQSERHLCLCVPNGIIHVQEKVAFSCSADCKEFIWYTCAVETNDVNIG